MRPESPDETLLNDDPHASKISPDDPRLRVERPRSRTLRMKPIIACVAVLLGVGIYTVLGSGRKADKKVAVAPEPIKMPDRPPAVPAFLQEVPDTPVPARPPAEFTPFSNVPPPSQPPSPVMFERQSRPDLQQQQLAQQDDNARTSSLFFESGSRAPNAPSASMAPPPPPLQGAGPEGEPAPRAPNPNQQEPGAWDPNLQGRKNAFLDAPKAHPDYLATTLQAPLSPYELKATAIIPATLITGINSDLPGPIIAQVREQVFDTATGRHLLIPQGARLLASYDSMVAWGQKRVLLCWERIIFPNGSSINLSCMPAADLKGQAGLTDEVDEHWGRLLAAVGLSTVLSLGMQAAAGNPTGYQPNLAQSAARNAAGEINTIGQGIVQRQINIQPTITVRPGFGVNVIVTKDMVLRPYVD